MMLFRPKIGLALGGGGARGAAHLGVLRHFESIQLIPDYLAGTSAGAVVAVLYAFGVPLKSIEEEMRDCKSVDFTSFRLKGLGLFENTEIEKLLKKLLPENALLENSKIPVAVKATDLLTGDGVILSSGPAIPAVLASCCVPGVYITQEIDGRLLVDGGLTENVPLSALKKLGAHVLIGVNLNGNEGYTRPQGVADVLSNAMDIAIDAQTRQQLQSAHLVISMDLTRFSRTSVEHIEELIAVGRESAKRKIWNVKVFKLWVRVKKLWRMVRDLLPLRVPKAVSDVLPDAEKK